MEDITVLCKKTASRSDKADKDRSFLYSFPGLNDESVLLYFCTQHKYIETDRQTDKNTVLFYLLLIINSFFHWCPWWGMLFSYSSFHKKKHYLITNQFSTSWVISASTLSLNSKGILLRQPSLWQLAIGYFLSCNVQLKEKLRNSDQSYKVLEVFYN